MAATDSCVAVCMPAICAPISSVALRGLRGERLHLRGDDREAAAGFAGARRLDGGVERQQVGLLGDRGDQLHDVADAARRLRQLVDAAVGLLRLLHRLVGDPARLLHLAADLVHRRGHLLGRRGDRLHVGGGLLGRGRDRAGQLLRDLGGLGQRAGGRLQLRRGRRDGLDDAADRGLEIVGELVHVGLALLGGALLRGGGFGFERARLDHVVLEHLHRRRHLADLVARAPRTESPPRCRRPRARPSPA